MTTTTTTTIMSSSSSSFREEEWMDSISSGDLRSMVGDAQQLANEILGHDASTELARTDLVEAMKTFNSLKEELSQLQRESQLTQRALVATQCSQTCIAKRLDKIPNYDTCDESMILEADVKAEENGHLEKEEEDDDEEEVAIMEDVPSPEDDNLEQEIMNILPTKSRSLGVGLLGDMEQCIVEWQQTFQDLNDQHEFQVQACQADIERLHVRLDAIHALHPSTRTGIEEGEAAKKARERLEELVRVVEEFPSKARVEALKRELEASKEAELQSQMKLARAVEDLDALRRREMDLVRRLEVATRPPIPLERPKNGPVPTVRLLRHTKKKLQRLFQLDRFSKNLHVHKQPVAPVTDDEANSSTSPSISEGAQLDTMIDTGLTMNTSSEFAPIDLSKLTPSDKDDSLVHSPKQSSSDGDLEDEELSVTDSLENFHRHDILSIYNASPSKSHSTEEDDLDLCKMDTDDTTSTSEATTSYNTETETDSSSGTPPPKVKKHPTGTMHESSSKSLFHMAKSLWWVQ